MRPSRLILIFSCCLLQQFASAVSYFVGPGRPVKQIKGAIEKSVNGDTIFIEKGIYHEGNIVVNKSISLIGLNNPVLDGRNTSEILTISASKFLVKGITFRNSGYSAMNDYASIKIIDAADFVIENNNIINSYFAIHVSNSQNFNICRNKITGSPGEEQTTGNGIHLWKSSGATIQGNVVSGHRDGIYFEFVTDSYIRNNFSERNIRYGLHFMFSNNDEYSSNTFRNNGAGVAVMFSKHVTMTKNHFEFNRGNSAYGILLKEISDGTISENIFVENTVGVFMEGTNRIEVSHNKFDRNGWGFKIQASCSDIIVIENDFRNNTFDVATNGSLSLNNFDRNYWDKYEGYDLDKNGIGDVPYHPVSLFAMITEEMPYCIVFYRSFLAMLMERMEKAMPQIISGRLLDNQPLMKPVL